MWACASVCKVTEVPGKGYLEVGNSTGCSVCCKPFVVTEDHILRNGLLEETLMGTEHQKKELSRMTTPAHDFREME